MGYWQTSRKPFTSGDTLGRWIYLLDANSTDFNPADVKHEEEGQCGGHQNSDVTTGPDFLGVCFSDRGDVVLLVVPSTCVDHSHLFGHVTHAESR